jgi:hypothetical protein
MNRISVQSSHIKSIGHDGNILEVEYFNGEVYQFNNISDDDFAALGSARSVGKALNELTKRDDVNGERQERSIVELVE